MTSSPVDELRRRDDLRSGPLALFERMVEIRLFEDRVNELFAEGLVHGTTHTCQGQEASAVGLAAALEATDQVVCTYRGHGVALALGADPTRVLGEIMGRVTGPVGGLGGSMHLLSPSVGLLPTMAIVGAGIPIAVGAALSATLLKTGAIGVAVFGDGATNIGAFHEGLNLAAIWHLPVLFVCENNLYGEYTRIDRSTPITDLALRAESYGMPSEIVDGQDVDEVMAAVAASATVIRRGGGPRLIELKTYRYAGHSRADTGPYRREGELDLWRENDPIENFRSKLLANGVASEPDLETLVTEVRRSIDSLVETTLAAASPGPAEMLRHVYPGGPRP